MANRHLAIDLGAESGRVISGVLEDGRLKLEEVHRFPNTPHRDGGPLQWNIPELFEAVKTGLRRAASNEPAASVSADSWGVDYLLFDSQGQLILPAYHYRDPRSAEGVKKALAKATWERIFAETGIQFMPINTVFQLAADAPDRLEASELLLGVGDAFNFLLSGKPWAEVSMASTTQLYNPRTRAWSEALIEDLGFPRRIFPPIVPSGTRLGPVRPELRREMGVGEIEVVASCSHDTAAAVVGTPAEPGDWAYLSSGTWSLMGVELTTPIINEECRSLNFTNEIGFRNTVRLLKNIIGLWIVQECRRAWASEGSERTYEELVELAAAAPAFAVLIDPTDERFLSPGGMPEKVAAYCRESGQTPPADHGATVRCVLESLALLYRLTLRQIERLRGRPVERLHIVGGGSKNRLLNQFTADATGVLVVAGPDEATAAGNVLVQSIALGLTRSLEEARDIVRRSFSLETFRPQRREEWDRAALRFDRLRKD